MMASWWKKELSGKHQDTRRTHAALLNRASFVPQMTPNGIARRVARRAEGQQPVRPE